VKSEMNARFFLDTNALIYATDPGDPRKNAIAVDWLDRDVRTGEGVVSYQVVQEWFNVVLRKAAVRLDADEADRIYRLLIAPLWRVQSSPELIDAALNLYRKDSLSWWDSIIVAAALQAGCRTLLSEDLQDGREIEGMRIENPFRESDS